MIAHSENRPRWHNERRQAKVNVRPRSSPISAMRTQQLLVGNNSSDLMARSCLQLVQQFCSAHVARCFPSCVVTSLCDSSDDFSTLAQENKSSSVYHLFTVSVSVPWHLFFPAGYEAFVPASVRPTAPCQYHPSGTTSHSLHCSHQKGVPAPLREPTLLSAPRPVLIVDLSQSQCPTSSLWHVLGYPNHLGMATSTMQTVISCIINIVSASVEPRPST